MKGIITRIEEYYPGAPHWYAYILIDDEAAELENLRLGWIKLTYRNQIYRLKIEGINKYEYNLNEYLCLYSYWSPESDVDEGPCITELGIGEVEFSYDLITG